MAGKIIGLIISIGLIIGGLSGQMVLRGTDSSTALIVVGFIFLAIDIYALATHKKKKEMTMQAGAQIAGAQLLPAPVPVTIVREKSAVGAIVKYSFTLNGSPVGELKNGQSLTTQTQYVENSVMVYDAAGNAAPALYFAAYPGYPAQIVVQAGRFRPERAAGCAILSKEQVEAISANAPVSSANAPVSLEKPQPGAPVTPGTPTAQAAPGIPVGQGAGFVQPQPVYPQPVQAAVAADEPNVRRAIGVFAVGMLITLIILVFQHPLIKLAGNTLRMPLIPLMLGFGFHLAYRDIGKSRIIGAVGLIVYSIIDAMAYVSCVAFLSQSPSGMFSHPVFGNSLIFMLLRGLVLAGIAVLAAKRRPGKTKLGGLVWIAAAANVVISLIMSRYAFFIPNPTQHAYTIFSTLFSSVFLALAALHADMITDFKTKHLRIKTGARVWCIIVAAALGISFIMSFTESSYAAVRYQSVMLIPALVGMIMLAANKRFGFALALIGTGASVLFGLTNIIVPNPNSSVYASAIVGGVLNPLITWLFIKKAWRANVMGYAPASGFVQPQYPAGYNQQQQQYAPPPPQQYVPGQQYAPSQPVYGGQYPANAVPPVNAQQPIAAPSLQNSVSASMDSAQQKVSLKKDDDPQQQQPVQQKVSLEKNDSPENGTAPPQGVPPQYDASQQQQQYAPQWQGVKTGQTGQTWQQGQQWQQWQQGQGTQPYNGDPNLTQSGGYPMGGTGGQPEQKSRKKWFIIIPAIIVAIVIIGTIVNMLTSSPSNTPALSAVPTPPSAIAVSDNITQLLSVGQRYLDDEEYEQALEQFNDIIDSHPEEPEGYIGAARAYIGMGSEEPAYAVLQAGYAETDSAKISEMLDELPQESEPEDSNEFGNTNGNTSNRAIAAIQGDWIYYTANDNGDIYKTNIYGTIKIYLASDGHHVNVVGDWVYFLKGDGQNLYKVRTDGTDEMIISNEYIRSFIVAGDFIYYTTMIQPEAGYAAADSIIESMASGEYGIWQMLTDGSAKYQIDYNIGNHLNIEGDWLYYIDSVTGGVFKVNTDGVGLTPLLEERTLSITVADGWIYYIDSENMMHKMTTEGAENEQLSTEHCNELNVEGEYIYYSNLSIGRLIEEPDYAIIEGRDVGIIRMRTDGTGRDLVAEGNAVMPSVVGDWIYFVDLDEMFEGTYCRVRTVGMDYHVIQEPPRSASEPPAMPSEETSAMPSAPAYTPNPDSEVFPVEYDVYDNSYSITGYRIGEDEDGNTMITFIGSGYDVITFRNNSLQIPAWCYCEAGGETIDPVSASVGGPELSIKFDRVFEPDIITVTNGETDEIIISFNTADEPPV